MWSLWHIWQIRMHWELSQKISRFLYHWRGKITLGHSKGTVAWLNVLFGSANSFFSTRDNNSSKSLNFTPMEVKIHQALLIRLKPPSIASKFLYRRFLSKDKKVCEILVTGPRVCWWVNCAYYDDFSKYAPEV